MRIKRSTRVKKSACVKKLPRFTAPSRVVAIFLVVIGIAAAAMLIAAREPSHVAAVETQPERATPKKVSAPTPKMRSAAAAPAATFGADMTGASAPPMELAAKPPVPTSAAVTITGCLERDNETFRLKDTTGVEAPRSRSWRSGFLKKRSASIDIVDAANRLKLTDHVGQRVSVTGMLEDREMRVDSLHRVAASCN